MQCVLPKTTIRIPMGDRTRIAKVIWKVFQNTPAINATDDEWESWWNDSTQEEKALCYAQADAVIVELTNPIRGCTDPWHWSTGEPYQCPSCSYWMGEGYV